MQADTLQLPIKGPKRTTVVPAAPVVPAPAPRQPSPTWEDIPVPSVLQETWSISGDDTLITPYAISAYGSRPLSVLDCLTEDASRYPLYAIDGMEVDLAREKLRCFIDCFRRTLFKSAPNARKAVAFECLFQVHLDPEVKVQSDTKELQHTLEAVRTIYKSWTTPDEEAPDQHLKPRNRLLVKHRDVPVLVATWMTKRSAHRAKYGV